MQINRTLRTLLGLATALGLIWLIATHTKTRTAEHRQQAYGLRPSGDF